MPRNEVLLTHEHEVLPLTVTVKKSGTMQRYYVEAFIKKRFLGEHVLKDEAEAYARAKTYFKHLSEVLMPIYEKGIAAA